MATKTGTIIDAIFYLHTLATELTERPLLIRPKDFSLKIMSSPQLIGMSQEYIIKELKSRGHHVEYSKINNDRFFTFK